MQECNISIANALEILQCCTKLSVCVVMSKICLMAPHDLSHTYVYSSISLSPNNKVGQLLVSDQWCGRFNCCGNWFGNSQVVKTRLQPREGVARPKQVAIVDHHRQQQSGLTGEQEQLFNASASAMITPCFWGQQLIMGLAVDNILSLWRYVLDFESVIFKYILGIILMSISSLITLRQHHITVMWCCFRWMPQEPTYDKSILGQVMAWCRRATSHYPGQY